MSFIFSQVNGSKIGVADQPVSGGAFYGAAFGQGVHDSMWSSIYRISEYHQSMEYDEQLNPMVRQAEANHYAQQEGIDFKFETDVTMDEMNLLLKRHIEKRDREMILSHGMTGGGRMAGVLGVGFLGSTLNPLDLAMNFVPIVGIGTKGANAAKAGVVGRALQRGLITQEALEKSGLAFKGYTAAIVEGSVGNAITEIPLMIANAQDETGYTVQDFGLAMGLGAVFGGLVNTGRLALRRAFKVHSQLTPETRENMAGAAMEDFVQGRTIDPGRLLALDNSVRDAQMRLGELTVVQTPRGPQPVKVKQPQDMWYFGGDASIQQFRLPIFVTSEKSGAEWYAAERTEAGKGVVHELEVKSKKPLYLDSEKAFVRDWIPLLKEANIEFFYAPSKNGGGWEVSIPEITNHSPYNGENIFDVAYIDRFREVAIKHGYDSLEGFDALEGGDIPIKVIIKSPDQAKIKNSETYTDGQRDITPEEQIATYKAHEDNKQAKLEADRELEIQNGSTLDDPDVYHFDDTVDDADLQRIQQEIADLEAELDIDLDVLQGNVKSVPTDSTLQNWNRWKAFLPEPRNIAEFSDGSRFYPDQPEFTAEQVSWGAAQLDPKVGKILDELLELDPDLKNVKVTFDPFLRFDEEAIGAYWGSTDEISIDMFTGNPETFAHELVHASTVKRIRKDFERLGESRVIGLKGENYIEGLKRYSAKTDNEGLKQIVDTYLEVIEAFSKRHPNLQSRANTGWKAEDPDVPYYGLSNLDEFMTEGLTNPQFRQVLSINPSKTGKVSLLSKFVDALKKLFELDDADGPTALGNLIDGYAKMVADQPNRLSGEFTPSRPVLQKASICAL